MSIENRWDYDPPTRKTCPECGGTGKDNATLDWKCYMCNGLGTIEIDKDERETRK